MNIEEIGMEGRESATSIARQWVSLWNAPVDWQLFDSLHADDFVDESSAGRAQDKRGFAQGICEMIDAFPDLKTAVEDVVVDQQRMRIAVRWSASGTNVRRYLGVGPTHKLTSITGIEIIEIRGGRIARRWGEWDITNHRDR